MLRVCLGRGLRRRDVAQLTFLGLSELLHEIDQRDVDLSEVERLVEKANAGLKEKRLRIEIRKSLPWDKRADYRLTLRKVRHG